MKDTTQLKQNQAEHIAEFQAKVDLMEHGVIHASVPLISELSGYANNDKLTIERLRTGVEQFNALLNCLNKQQRELDDMFDFYVKKNSESEGAANA